MPPLQPDEPLPEITLASSPYGALLFDSLARVKDLQLQGISRDNRHIMRVPWGEHLTPPYVSLSLFPEGIDPTAGPAGKDEVIYAMMVAVVAANKGHVSDEKLAVQLYWRWRLMQAFHNQRGFIVSLPDGVCSVGTEVVPGESHLPAAIRIGYDAQYWLVRFRVWEVRPQQ